MFEDQDLVEFLERSVKRILENSPKKVITAYIDSNNGVTFTYKHCTYADLQHVGQELINEGIMNLVAQNKDHLEELEAEAESDDEDEDSDEV